MSVLRKISGGSISCQFFNLTTPNQNQLNGSNHNCSQANGARPRELGATRAIHTHTKKTKQKQDVKRPLPSVSALLKLLVTILSMLLSSHSFSSVRYTSTLQCFTNMPCSITCNKQEHKRETASEECSCFLDPLWRHATKASRIRRTQIPRPRY